MLHPTTGNLMCRKLFVLLTKHEEGRRHVDPDERQASVHQQAEGGAGGEGGTDDSKKTHQRLRAHPVTHHGGHDAEADHDDDGGEHERQDGDGVVLQLRLKGL